MKVLNIICRSLGNKYLILNERRDFMEKEKIYFIAPSLKDENYSTAYILGNIVWLMMNSPTHREMPLLMMPTQIFPAISNRQYVLGMKENGSPLFYMAWAYFTAEDEAQYIQQTNMALTMDNWNQGDRLWLLFAIAPFGHFGELNDWARENVFRKSTARYLAHRGKTRGTRVLVEHGVDVTSEECLDWHEAHPLLVDVPITLPRGVSRVARERRDNK